MTAALDRPRRHTRHPQWLASYLTRIGRADDDGVTRRARWRLCRHCHLLVLVGLDSEPLGFSAAADPHPLDPTGELQALATGRRTYELMPDGGRHVLEHRDSSSIRARPADPAARWPVLAEHRCGMPLGKPPATNTAIQQFEEPPF